MENFLSKAEPFERSILQRYVDRCSKFYGFVTICVYLACFGFIIEPIILTQVFPTDTIYPFAVEFHPVYEIIYIQQAVAIFHIAAALSVDNQIAILLWFTSARFEMVGDEVQNAINDDDLRCCISKHQEVLDYAKDVTRATRIIAMATITTTTIGIICGGLTLISVSRDVRFNMEILRSIEDVKSCIQGIC